MSGTQLQDAVAFWQTVCALSLSLMVESFCLLPGQVRKGTLAVRTVCKTMSPPPCHILTSAVAPLAGRCRQIVAVSLFAPHPSCSLTPMVVATQLPISS